MSAGCCGYANAPNSRLPATGLPADVASIRQHAAGRSAGYGHTLPGIPDVRTQLWQGRFGVNKDWRGGAAVITACAFVAKVTINFAGQHGRQYAAQKQHHNRNQSCRQTHHWHFLHMSVRNENGSRASEKWIAAIVAFRGGNAVGPPPTCEGLYSPCAVWPRRG